MRGVDADMDTTDHTEQTLVPGRDWIGGAALWPGVGLFIGRSGDNHEHHHWAHQLVIGLEGDVEMRSGAAFQRAPALFVRAGVPHRLMAGTLLSVWLDPSTALSDMLCSRLDGTAPVYLVPPDVAQLLRDCFSATTALEAAMDRIRAELIPCARAPDERLRRVLAALAPSEDAMERPDRRRLAALVGLSETRFSHWFKEATGMPLRSYRKWLYLVYGLEHALRGQNLTAAAFQADFTDQAHFSRAFVQMFGVRASDILAQVRLIPGARPGRAAAQRAQTGMSFFDSRCAPAA